ncbi:hypothetical protein [Leptospira saintgironsiae]|uniref:Uncharacterized protein n=1 Tax=Leptospira saintgironsiae TaxID=2023183 RepID=A0A2M9Y960_9LEPT|nr:hypothetical protein [Leptospira saintgironsiae]PJZ47973.1 hypothetical protein CH362_16930 [Leptospira saintgironsiae]
MKILHFYFLSFSFVLTTYCASLVPTGMVKGLVESAPSANWIPIHSNPKVGDFAVYQGLDGTKTKVEIMSQKGAIFEVKNTFLETSSLLHFMKDYEEHLFIDKEGYAKEGFMIEISTSRKITKRVANEKDVGYIPNPKSFGVKKTNLTITTKAGTFKIDSIIVIAKDFANGKFNAMYFISPQAKFGMVQSRVVGSADLQLDTLATLISGNNLVGYIVGEFGKLNFKEGADLVESN